MKIVWMLPRSGYVTDPRSVTLWGTICWGIRYLFGNEELEAFLKKHVEGAPDFVISSAFPFKKWKSERLPFFPNLLRVPPEINPNDDVDLALKKYRLGKKLSKIEWLSQTQFEKMLQGELTVKDLLDTMLDEFEKKKVHNERRKRRQMDENGLPVKGDYRTKNEDALKNTPPERHDHSMTHNTIDRLRGGTLNLLDAEGEQSGQLFHTNDIWWADPENDNLQSETGLFFLVDGSDEQIENLLAPVLRFLEHWGIGADRTAGKGFFKFEIQEFLFAEPAAEASNALVNLSLFIPKDEEQLVEIENAKDLPYQLENRECKGWSPTGGFQKAPTLFFAEGSVFPKLSGSASRGRGRLLHNRELPNGQKVYDNGFGFMVNLNWKNQ